MLRYATYGRKEEDLYVNVSQIGASTLGHGTILRRYNANTNIDRTRVGAQLDVDADVAGFESFVNDVIQPNLLGGLAYVRPFSLLSSSTVAEGTSFGVAYVTDLSAPVVLDRFDSGVPRTDVDGAFQVLEERQVWAAGISVETKVVKTKHVDVKPYVDHSFIGELGTGQTLGVLLRTNFGEQKDDEGTTTPRHALRLVLEGRRFDGDYLPGYFDTFYELSKFQLLRPSRNFTSEPKFTELALRDPEASHLGYYVEASYALVGDLGLAIGWEDADAENARSIFGHLDFQALSFLQLLATIQRRDLSRGDEVFQVGHTDNTLAIAAFRLRALPFLFVNGSAYKQFELNRSVGSFEAVDGIQGDVELGWEF